jgi:hypothetical protein
MNKCLRMIKCINKWWKIIFKYRKQMIIFKNCGSLTLRKLNKFKAHCWHLFHSLHRDKMNLLTHKKCLNLIEMLLATAIDSQIFRNKHFKISIFSAR